MSPFSHALLNLRIKHNFRQRELAELLGYEQSYISALEIGLKSLPNQDFMERVIKAFQMSSEEANELTTAYWASERKLTIEPDSPEDVFWLIDDLRQTVAYLSLEEVQALRSVLRLHPRGSRPLRTNSRRAKRPITEENTM